MRKSDPGAPRRASAAVVLDPAQAFLFGYDRELPLQAAVRSANERGAVTVKLIDYLSSGPARVPALLALPAASNSPAILIQHGGGESKDDPLIRLLLSRWALAGFACLAIDAPGHGERSLGIAGPRRGFHEYLRARVQNVIDLRRAIDLLAAETDCDPARLGYWGVSMGGGVGIMLMAADPRVRAACLCLAGARSRRSWPAAAAETQDFVAKNLDPLALAPLIGEPRGAHAQRRSRRDHSPQGRRPPLRGPARATRTALVQGQAPRHSGDATGFERVLRKSAGLAAQAVDGVGNADRYLVHDPVARLAVLEHVDAAGQ